MLQIPAVPAGAAVGNGGLLGQLAQAGIGLGFDSVLLKFSRTDESQADALGARIMSEAGYNPIELARFFEKLQSEGGAWGPAFQWQLPPRRRGVLAMTRRARSICSGHGAEVLPRGHLWF